MQPYRADFHPAINRGEVLRYLGYKKGVTELPPDVDRLIEEETAHAMELIRPQGSWRTFKVHAREENLITVDGAPLSVTGPKIIKALGEIDSLTALVVTIGSQLEEAVSAFFEKGELARASILDSIGSDAVEETAEHLNRLLDEEAAREGHYLSSRLSPGYGDWDLAVQPELVMAAGGEGIGVRVTPEKLLIPRKTVSAILGWRMREMAPEEEAGLPVQGCAGCGANCPFRGEVQE